MTAFLFFIAAFGAIAGAVGVVMLRDPFFSVLALVAHLLSLSLLFLLLRAEFVAAAQVVVYAGAVMVLYVFVVAYVGDSGHSIGQRMRRGASTRGGLRLGGALLGGAVLVELLIALLGSGLKAIEGYGAGYRVGGPESQTFGTPAYIGNLLLTRFLLVFEVASFLLLIAAVGGVVLARRRGGLGEDDPVYVRLTPLDLLRPRGTGSMAEAVGGLPFAARHADGGAEVEHGSGASEGAPQPVAVGGPGQGGDPGEHPAEEGGW
jgi:NADH-quinone oxidoreductase subunit J